MAIRAWREPSENSGKRQTCLDFTRVQHCRAVEAAAREIARARDSTRFPNKTGHFVAPRLTVSIGVDFDYTQGVTFLLAPLLL